MVEGQRLFNTSERRNLRRAADRYDTAAREFSGNRLARFYHRVSRGDTRDYSEEEIRKHLINHARQYRMSAEE